ncbi:NINE protein [Robiginitalea sp.]|uniref:TM2 domain-containing protein n=1 Tax=Robiginitalea sp. TaxID=1902411 RepID=UPI003C78F049
MAEDKKDLGDQAEDAFDKAKKKAGELADEASELGEESKKVSKDLGDKIKEKAKELADDTEEVSEEAKARAKEFGEKAKQKAKEFGAEAEEAASGFKDEAKKTAEEFSDGFKSATQGENKKILAGILAIVLGWAGIHKFILGYQKEGIIMLVISAIGMVLTCIGIGVFLLWAMGLIGLVEGIIYLTKSDEDFYNTYQVGRKPWF